MREDRHFRRYFDRTAIKGKPANPWRGSPASAAKPAGGADKPGAWRDEGRPGGFSLLVYAIAGACLAICVGTALSDQYHDAIALDAVRAFTRYNVHAQIQEFLDHVGRWFPNGII